MNKMKRALASVGVGLALALSGGTVAQVAVADVSSKAEAYTYKQGPEKWQHDRFYSYPDGRWYCGVWANIDYSWGEEVFQGKRDGWTRLYWAWC